MPSRAAALVLCTFLATSEAARVNHARAGLRSDAAELMKTGAWLTETCQDYPEELGFGLGDTVRIHRPGSSADKHVGLVGCQELEHQGKICLEGLKGCYAAEELRPVSTLVFTFHTLQSATSQIFGAVKDDVKDAWQDVKIGLADFLSSTSDRITDARVQVAAAVNVCDPAVRENAANKMDAALVATRSRLAMLVDSASERWTDLKEGAADMAAAARGAAEATKAKIVKLSNELAQALGDAYDATLRAKVEALQKYLGAIADAVTNVPDELNPVADVEVKVPDGLTQAVEKVSEGIAELSEKIRELSKAAYDKVAPVIAAMQSGAGKLIAWASERWTSVKIAVRAMAAKAAEKVSEWSSQALEFACNFDAKEAARAAFAAVQEKFWQAVEAVKRGYASVKQSLEQTAEDLKAMVVSVGVGIKATSKELYESEAVQGTLATLKEEIRVLKELIVEQATLVQKMLSGIFRYFGRFIPQAIKDKVKTAAQKAKELAEKIKAQVAELVSKYSDGETDTIEVDANTGTA